MHLEQIQFDIAAGETKRFEAAGRYFEVIDAVYAFDVVFTDENGGQSGRAKGAESGFYVNAPFKGFDLTNGSTAQTIALLVTDGSGGSRRQPGVVQVVDTRSIRTREGRAYAWRYSAAAAAGQYPTATLQNPAGSGKRLVIVGLSLGSSIAGGVSFGFADNGPVVGAPNVLPQNKMRGGAASIASAQTSSAVALYGGTQMRPMDSAFMQASASRDVSLQEPIVVAPGQVFVIAGESVAQQIAGRIEYYEEPNT